MTTLDTETLSLIFSTPVLLTQKNLYFISITLTMPSNKEKLTLFRVLPNPGNSVHLTLRLFLTQKNLIASHNLYLIPHIQTAFNLNYFNSPLCLSNKENRYLLHITCALTNTETSHLKVCISLTHSLMHLLTQGQPSFHRHL